MRSMERLPCASNRARPGNCCSASVSEASCDPITSNIYTAEQESELPDMAIKASLGCGNPDGPCRIETW